MGCSQECFWWIGSWPDSVDHRVPFILVTGCPRGTNSMCMLMTLLLLVEITSNKELERRALAACNTTYDWCREQTEGQHSKTKYMSLKQAQK